MKIKKKLITGLILTFVLTGMSTIVFAAYSEKPEALRSASGYTERSGTRSATIEHAQNIRAETDENAGSEADGAYRQARDFQHFPGQTPTARLIAQASPPPPATPPPPPGPAAKPGLDSQIMENIGKLFAIILKGISVLILPIIMLSGALMKSDFLFSGTMNETLLSIWDQVRDIVNVIFVVLLIVIALYNVLGLGEAAEGGAYLQLKKAIPKLVLGLILVNFSYLGVRMIVDVVNVGTSIAFAIPNSTGLPQKVTAQMQSDFYGKQLNLLCSVTGLANTLAPKLDVTKKTEEPKPAKGKGKGKEKSKSSEPTVKDICEKNPATEKLELTPEASKRLTEWNIDGAVPIFALKYMNLQKLDKVSTKLAEKGGSVDQLTLQMFLSIIMFLLYGVCFIALFSVLLARAVMLWMVIVLSPLMAIQITFPQIVSKAGGSEYAGKIIKTLIAPIIVGFILSVGFMILETMQGVDYSTDPNLSTISLTTAAAGTDLANVDTFQQLLIAVGAVAFIFIGVQSALSDAIGGGFASAVMNMAKGAGTWLAKAPLMYSNLFPVKMPGGGSEAITGGAMLKVLEGVPQALDRKNYEQSSKVLEQIFGGKGIGAKLEGITGKGENDMSTLADTVRKSSSGDLEKEAKNLLSAMKKLKSSGKFNDPRYAALKDLTDQLEKAGDDPAKLQAAVGAIKQEMEKPQYAELAAAAAGKEFADRMKTELEGFKGLKINDPELKKIEDGIKSGTITSKDQLTPDQSKALDNARKQAEEIRAAPGKAATALAPAITAAQPALKDAAANPQDKTKESAADAGVKTITDKINEQETAMKNGGISPDEQQRIIVELIDKSSLTPEEKAQVGTRLSKEKGLAGNVGKAITVRPKPGAARPAEKPPEEPTSAPPGSGAPPGEPPPPARPPAPIPPPTP